MNIKNSLIKLSYKKVYLQSKIKLMAVGKGYKNIL